MKIFLSTGSLLPMDRLVNAVDYFISTNPGYTCAAQIGQSKIQTACIETWPILEEHLFRQYFNSADVIVSHAGMGNVLMARELDKPIIIMARRTALNENINDHQIDTLKGLKDKHFVYCINEAEELESAISWAREWQPKKTFSHDRERLVKSIKEFISELD